MNKFDSSKTFTVGTFLSVLKDGQVTEDMPISIVGVTGGTFDPVPVKGVMCLEIHTYEDGTKAISFGLGETCAKAQDIKSATEIFPIL